MENDLKMDTRKNPENLYAVRMMIVRLNKQGLGPMAIKEQTGVSYGAIRKAIDLYTAGGAKALRPKTRGCKKGTAKRLTDEQEKDVQNAIRDKRPEQLKMDFALWTREAVMKYIEEHHGVKLPVRTVGDYLKRWGFTPQKPIKVAYELNPDERLNAELKHAITTSVPKRTRQGLLKKTEEHMTMVASTPERVKSYFKDKHVSYSADSQ